MILPDLNKIKSADKIIIDANVLLYVFCPLNSENNESFISHFSDVLDTIRKFSASVYVNSLIISEFINTWLRMDFKKTNYKHFKDEYRACERYKTTLKSILRQLSIFYTHWNVQNINDNFNEINFFKKYEAFPSSDFNDILIAENAISNEYKLLTQDNDFTQYGVNRIQ